MTTFLTTLAPFDFRGDVDQMALLKTLPAPAWRLALGQVLTPVLIFTLLPLDRAGGGAMALRTNGPVAVGRRRLRPAV